ncbi:MAG: lysozyme [Ewingella sp.]
MTPSIVKRCLVAVILGLVALLPQTAGLHTSEQGLRLIADFEGCRLSAYQCSANVWTIGIGHTEGVTARTQITEYQAAVNLVADIQRVERGIARCMAISMPQEVYDAVVSFAFNVGVKAACGSTLAFFINKAHWRSACEQLPRWVFVKGVRSAGLERRRANERAYCLNGA